jgi:hypothetical protein
MNEMSFNHHDWPHHRELSATYLSQAIVAVPHTRFTVVRPANAIAGDKVYYVTITNTSVWQMFAAACGTTFSSAALCFSPNHAYLLVLRDSGVV